MTADTPDHPSTSWPRRADFKRSIRVEFSLFVSALILILMIVTGYVIMQEYAASAMRHAVETLFVQARSYSGPAGKHILSADGPDVLLLSDICKKLALDNPDVYWAGITGKDGRFLAHTDLRRVIAGQELSLAGSVESSVFARPGERFSVDHDTVYISIPILENRIALGTLAVASSGRQIAEARRRAAYTVGSITLVMVLAGIPLIMFMLQRKLRPLSIITQSLQSIDLDRAVIRIPVRSGNELGYLAETLRVMGTKLEQVRHDMLEKERIAREMEIAHEVQQSLLPRTYPAGDTFEFAGAYRSAREVGGDYYDFIDLDAEHLAFLVADVSGKSLPGMLVMLLTRDIIQRLTRSVPEPTKLLSDLNRELLPNIRRGMFVTMFFGVLNKRTGRFQFACAGHNPLIAVHGCDGQYELHRPNGYPLGMMGPDRFEERLQSAEVQLAEGDWLIQFTDGINEAHNASAEEFGMKRFVQLLTAYRTLPPHELVAETLKQHEAFVGSTEQSDDITLLAMKWKGRTSDIHKVVSRGALHAGQG